MSPSLTLYRKLLTSPLLASHPHYGVVCLPDTLLENSATIAVQGSLLTVGGHDNSIRTDIHLYQPESEQWIKVGDLPSARHYCSCVVLPSGELLVAGGEESYARTSRVDVASVLN